MLKNDDELNHDKQKMCLVRNIKYKIMQNNLFKSNEIEKSKKQNILKSTISTID